MGAQGALAVGEGDEICALRQGLERQDGGTAVHCGTGHHRAAHIGGADFAHAFGHARSEEHTSELQSQR